MKEITFLRQNYQRWMEFENLLNAGEFKDPDALADLFIRITDDLSWARTFYPGTNTEKYLNDLAARIHQEIYKNKKEKRSRLLTFWSREFPALMGRQQFNLWIAMIIFVFSVWVGVISAANDESFVRLILGDNYVDMTLDNMKNGHPLDVYNSDNHFIMFFQIALNNSFVAILCILAGMLHWLGVGFMMFRNGVMLGAFMYFLAANGYLYEASHTVWIHGVIEIWCIVVAGAGGIVLGNSLWFPGAWPRGESFRRGGRDALKIAIGLVPFFFLAAFFEGFVTRYDEMNDISREAIIFSALIFVLWYFCAFPFILRLKGKNKEVAMMVHSRLTRILMWTAIVVTAPIVPITLALIKVRDNARRVSLLEYLTRVKQVNPITMVRILLGMLMILLPTIALSMAFITHDRPDEASIFFFCLCYTAGIAMIIWAAYMVNRYEESDLRIERNSRVKDTVYESKGTSVKV